MGLEWAVGDEVWPACVVDRSSDVVSTPDELNVGVNLGMYRFVVTTAGEVEMVTSCVEKVITLECMVDGCDIELLFGIMANVPESIDCEERISKVMVAVQSIAEALLFIKLIR